MFQPNCWLTALRALRAFSFPYFGDDKKPAAGRGAVRRDQVLSDVEGEEETDEIKIIDKAPGKSLAFSL